MLILLILWLTTQIATQKADEVMITNIPSIERATVSQEQEEFTEYDNIISKYCMLHGVDQNLVKILIQKESEFNPRALSKSGAQGLMQLMPETAKNLGVKDAFDPNQNIEAGIRFLRYLIDLFEGNVQLALAAYHAGPGLVKRINRIPAIPETVEYVDYIMSRYDPSYINNTVHFTLTEEGTPLLTNRPK